MVCNGNPETVVLCHDNLPGVGGYGMKSPNECAALGCSSCHDLVDGRTTSKIWEKDEIKLMFYEGMSRTIAMWVKER
jgi:hypothetical protein